MRTFFGLSTLLLASVAFSYGDSLLDQDFRRLASDEVVNLGEAYARAELFELSSGRMTDSSFSDFRPMTSSARNPERRRISRNFVA